MAPQRDHRDPGGKKSAPDGGNRENDPSDDEDEEEEPLLEMDPPLTEEELEESRAIREQHRALQIEHEEVCRHRERIAALAEEWRSVETLEAAMLKVKEVIKKKHEGPDPDDKSPQGGTDANGAGC